MKITLKTIGRLKCPSLKALLQTYEKRLKHRVLWEEYDVKKKSSGDALKKAEASLLLQKIPDQAFVLALDEQGKNLTSADFAHYLLENVYDVGKPLFILIGGAEGLAPEVRHRADLLLSLGRMTWPHMLVRPLIIEQLYRAQQIIAGHPYHKE